MYLRYYNDENGKRVYTFKFHYDSEKGGEERLPTCSAHPARFSPDDQFQKERIKIKMRYNLLPTQQEPIKF